jgi:molecular chaperone Hsp33
MDNKDIILRCTGEKAALRFVMIDLTTTANLIGQKHGAEAWALAAMAETAIASLFLSSALKSQGSVSVRAEFSGDISLVQADSTPMGLIRAMIPKEELDKIGDFELMLIPQLLKVKKTNEKGKQLSEGIVEMVSDRMGRNLATFLLQSEQVRSAVGIEARPNQQNPKVLDYAIGFMVEAFPDIDEKTTLIMEQCVTSLPALSEFFDGQYYDLRGLLDQLSGPFAVQIHREIVPQAYCPCSRERSLASLKSFGAKELKAMIDTGRDLEVICDFCRTNYQITPEELRNLNPEAGSL